MKIVELIFAALILAEASHAGIKMHDHDLAINIITPPAILVVSDSSGNKSGVDQSKPLDQYGQGSSISNIPGSYVEQMNIADPEGNPPDQPQPNTSWSIFIVDQPAQTYTLNLIGNDSGSVSLTVLGGYRGKISKNIPTIVQTFLEQNGGTRSVQVNYDPSSAALTVTPNINNGDFLRDTQSACGLGAISPPEACEALEGLASAVEEAKTDGKSKTEEDELKAYLSILNRLHNWGHDGYRKDWDDFKDQTECGPLFKRKWDGIKVFANDPAYSALKLDVQTLLNALPHDGGDQGDRDNHKNDR